MVAVYESGRCYEELAELLGKAAASSKTPIIRQLDYLLRLGYVAEAVLGDSRALALGLRAGHQDPPRSPRSARRPGQHRTGSRRTSRACAEILGKQREIADSEEEAFSLGWEQAQLLLHEVDDPAEAAGVLADMARDLGPATPTSTAACSRPTRPPACASS